MTRHYDVAIIGLGTMYHKLTPMRIESSRSVGTKLSKTRTFQSFS